MTNQRFRPRLGLLHVGAAVAILSLGCGKSGEGGPCTTCPSPAIAISVSPNSLTIEQGGNGNLVATITRSGGFTGAVTIATEGAPAGVTAAASNVTTNGNVTTGTVTVTVAGSAVPGTYNLTVRGSGSGVTSVTMGVTLTVTAAPAIAVAVSAATQSVEQGATGAALTMTITRTNFPGTVTLTVEGAPAGVTPTLNPASTTGNTASLTLQIGAAVPAATYNLIIRGTGTGVTAATAPLTLAVTVPPSFALAATAVTIDQGAQGQSTVTLTRINTAAAVALALEGAPAGVTGAFNPPMPTETTSTLTLTVGAAVTPGPHPLTVRGTTAGLADRTTRFILTVTAVVTGSYTLTTTPSPSLLVGAASGGVAFVVTVNRIGGFTGPVTLSASGLLSSLNATFTPSVVTGNSAAVTVVPDQSGQVGSSQVTITGTTPGLANRTTQLQIATALPDLTFDYSACLASVPLWLGYQDGKTGPWIQLLPLGGRFKIKLTQNEVGFAIVLTGFGNNHPSWIRYRSTAEMKAISGIELCDQGNPGPKNVVATTANLGTFESAQISLGGAVRNASAGLPTVTLMGVQNGVHDLVATNAFQGFNPFLPTARIIILRDLNVPNGQNIGTPIDFTPGAGLAFAPIAANINVAGLAGGDIVNSVGTTYSVGASCSRAFLFGSSGGITTAFGVPAAKQRPGDVTGVSVSTQNSVGAFSLRQVTEYFTGLLADRSIALPSNVPVPTVSVLSGPALRLRFQFTVPSDLAGQVFMNYGSAVSMDATAAWLGGTAVDLAFPDLTGSANFDVTWLPPSTPTAASWFLSLAGAPRINPCAGGRVVGASRNGSTP